MKIIRGIHNFKKGEQGLCLTMGNFDGLHMGHQRVITSLMERASEAGGKGMVVTFNPHPRWVLHPESPTLLLTTLHERASLLSQWGLDYLLLLRFNTSFAQLDPERFVKEAFVQRLGVHEVVVGEGFSFGHRKAGTMELLMRLGERYGFLVTKVPPLTIDGDVVSSTIIRNNIQAGDIQEANRLMGHEYCLTGKVIQGHHRGGSIIGYPTANLKVLSKVLPPNGVYLVRVERKRGEWHGLANLGSKPTFGEGETVGVEVHILDLHEDLYGQRLTVYFQKRIREEIAFSSPHDLSEQIKEDIQKVNRWIMNQPQ